jgi:hypothetical protein
MPGPMTYRYHKGVDIPAWVFQFIICLVLIGLSATALALFRTVDDGLNDLGDFNEDYDYKHKRSYDPLEGVGIIVE